MIGLMILMVTAGLVLAGLSGSMPVMILQVMMFVVGILIAFVGMMMLYGRAAKTGAIHLLEQAQPDSMIWFYIQRDGNVKITPSIRRIEGMSENTEIGYVQDRKSYRLFDHQVRFVPEDLGHTADHRHALYAQVLKTKYGFENLKDGRRKLLFWQNQQKGAEFEREGE